MGVLLAEPLLELKRLDCFFHPDTAKKSDKFAIFYMVFCPFIFLHREPSCRFFFKKLKNESGGNLFSRSVPFESRQSGWRDSAHGVTHGVGAWPGADIAPCWPESRQAYWHDLVVVTAVARLMGHMSYDVWVLVG
jgi:hypothetical protein